MNNKIIEERTQLLDLLYSHGIKIDISFGDEENLITVGQINQSITYSAVVFDENYFSFSSNNHIGEIEVK